MKLSLVLLMILLLTLGVVACSDLSGAPKESQSNIESNSALSRTALEVPTIF